MNRRSHDYPTLEREFMTGDISLRELCREHGISNPSAVIAQARRHGWAAKREQFRNRSTALTIEKTADRDATRFVRELEVRDNAIEAIDEAITKMRTDMAATHMVERAGHMVEEPVYRIGPKDLAILIDRMNVIFGKPSIISEERNLGLSFSADGLPPEFLRSLIDATGAVGKSVGGPSRGTPLPRIEGDREN